jgi:hypothetical protein
LINPRACRRVAAEFLDSQALIYFSGLIAGTGGLAIVLTHEIWTADWRVIITLLGWIAFLTAIARIVMPGVAEPVGRFIFETRGMMSAAGAIILTLGLCLSYAGFVA